MEYTTTNRGALSLIYNGYGYYKKRDNKSGEVFWLCSKSYNGGCLGKVIVKEEVVLREEAQQCVPDVAKLEVKKAIANAKKRVRQEDNITVAKICKQYLEYYFPCQTCFRNTSLFLLILKSKLNCFFSMVRE